MLRYSKTLFLAIIIAIPAIAMQEEPLQPLQDPILAGCGVQQPAIFHDYEKDVTLTTPTYDLNKTAYDLKNLVQQEEKLQQLALQKEEAEKQRNKTRNGLLDKKIQKGLVFDGAKALVSDLSSKILAVQKEKDQRAQELAAEEKREVARIQAEVETKRTEYNNDADKKIKNLSAQKEQAENDLKTSADEIVTIQETIDKADKINTVNKKEPTKQKGRWYRFGW